MEKSGEIKEKIYPCPKCGRETKTIEEIPEGNLGMVFCKYCKGLYPTEWSKVAGIYLARQKGKKNRELQQQDQEREKSLTSHLKENECWYCKNQLSKNYREDHQQRISNFFTPIYLKVQKFSRTSRVRSDNRRISPTEVQFKMTHTKYQVSRKTFPYVSLDGNVCQQCSNAYFDQIKSNGKKINQKMQVSPYEVFVYSTPLIFLITILVAILADDIIFLFVAAGGFALMLSSWLLGYWGFYPKIRLRGLNKVIDKSMRNMMQVKNDWKNKIRKSK